MSLLEPVRVGVLMDYVPADGEGFGEGYEAYPDLAPLFAVLAEALDEQTVQELNERIEVAGEDPRTVARSWLEAEGLI